jgi:hypothetical protein
MYQEKSGSPAPTYRSEVEYNRKNAQKTGKVKNKGIPRRQSTNWGREKVLDRVTSKKWNYRKTYFLADNDLSRTSLT